MNEEERCNTTLGLGIGVGIKREKQSKQKKTGFWLDLSLPIHPIKIEARDHDHDEKDDQESFSSKTTTDDQQEEEEERRMKASDWSNVDVYNNNINNDGSRKKLKLTTDQTTLLEDSFKLHSTLNTGQKQELAKKLNLLPRQIEVWFQNRRARTKLKQIEQECELLKKCCETLGDENRRLKKELQEARSCCCSLKFDHRHEPPLPFYIQYPSTAAMRHPCDKKGKTDEDSRENGSSREWRQAVEINDGHEPNKN